MRSLRSARTLKPLSKGPIGISSTRLLRRRIGHTRNGVLSKTHVSAPSRTSSTSHPVSDADESYFRYTGGRWLWSEEQQLKIRYKAFHIDELQRIAASAVQAQACVSFTKIGEGSYNKVFRLIMDNGVSVIARVPNPNAGPRKLCTSSEVATMDLARNFLDLPVPKIYAWDSDPDNAVGSEYIIMEEARGSNLSDTWGTMSLEAKVSVVHQIVSIERKLLSLSFSKYGSLYYANEKISKSEKIKVMGDLTEERRKEIEDLFVMGPAVTHEYWEDERTELDIDRGPWTTAEACISAPAHREIAWIKNYAVPMLPTDPLYTSAAQNSPDLHVSLLNRYLAVYPLLLPTDEDLNSARLWHRDLHAGNLFVSDGQITGLIDWQATPVKPFLLQGRHPRLIQYEGEVRLRKPEDFGQLPEDQRKLLEDQVSRSILLYSYETQTAKRNPLLHKFFHLNHGRTIIDTINFSGDTWTDDIRPLFECLIRVERDWEQICPGVPCPIHFTAEEIETHRENSEGWNEVQDFWNSVEGLITRDGWTSHETYPEALDFFQELRAVGLKNMIGEEREEFKAQTDWAAKPNEDSQA